MRISRPAQLPKRRTSSLKSHLQLRRSLGPLAGRVPFRRNSRCRNGRRKNRHPKNDPQLLSLHLAVPDSLVAPAVVAVGVHEVVAGASRPSPKLLPPPRPRDRSRLYLLRPQKKNFRTLERRKRKPRPRQLLRRPREFRQLRRRHRVRRKVW